MNVIVREGRGWSEKERSPTFLNKNDNNLNSANILREVNKSLGFFLWEI